jgi:hypothetical protein
MNILIILATFIAVNYAYERNKNFKTTIDEISKLANWGLFIITALIAIAIIYFTQS